MKAIILTPYHEGSYSQSIADGADLVICADTSFAEAEQLGIIPDVIIGDFDHEDITNRAAGSVITVPCEKDDTDTMLCIKYAIDKGADYILITGGIGGRLDHTIANIQSLAYAESKGVKAELSDGKNRATIASGKILIPRAENFYLSLFAYGGSCSGVSVRGTKYTLEDSELSVDFPLGVSNEITAQQAEIEVKSGRLLIILSKKEA